MANKLYIGNSVLVDLSNYYTKGEVDTAISNVDVSDQLSNYVEKDGDKVLSDNNFTDQLKTKLDGLSNFDPTSINSAISAIESTLGDITGDGAAVTAALDTWAEIKAFISDYTNAQDLQDLINTTTTNIQTWVGNQGYLTSSAAAAAYQPKIDGTPIVQGFHDVYEDGTYLVPGGTHLTPDALSANDENTNKDPKIYRGAVIGGYGQFIDVDFVTKFGINTVQNYYDGEDDYGSENNLLFAIGNGLDPILTTLSKNLAGVSGTPASMETMHNAFEVRQNGDVYIPDTSSNQPFYNKPMVHLQTAVAKANASIQNTGGVTAIVKLTQSAFNALASKDSGTLYIVEDDPVQAGS